MGLLSQKLARNPNIAQLLYTVSSEETSTFSKVRTQNAWIGDILVQAAVRGDETTLVLTNKTLIGPDSKRFQDGRASVVVESDGHIAVHLPLRQGPFGEERLVQNVYPRDEIKAGPEELAIAAVARATIENLLHNGQSN